MKRAALHHAPPTNELTPRRGFLRGTSGLLGLTALGQLLGVATRASGGTTRDAATGNATPRANPPAVAGFPQFAPRAKQAIFLFQAGGPSQLDLLDYKPMLRRFHGQDLPKSVMGDAKFTGMVNGQSSFPVVASPWKFRRHGQSGAWVSELFPHLAGVVDELCIIRSMTTPLVDHDAAITYLQTGHQLAGRPTAGAWLSYGLGSECDDLPAFVVMRTSKGGSFLIDRHWGAGFLPSRYQGVRFGGSGEPVQYLNNPPGVDASLRRQSLDDLRALNELRFAASGDPEIETRITQYEMAFRMQSSVPALTDLSDEPASTFELYGDDAREPGTYAYSALLARRLIERGVRCVQLFQGGWDNHSNLPRELPDYCRYSDRANAALVADLKRRGLLDETLVIWGGEFGRTVFCQGKLEADNFGREHHGLAFTIWLAGGGTKPGLVHGASDEWGFRAVEQPMTVHDLYATILHLLGIDHTRLTFRFQGRDYRLTDLYGQVVDALLA